MILEIFQSLLLVGLAFAMSGFELETVGTLMLGAGSALCLVRAAQISYLDE